MDGLSWDRYLTLSWHERWVMHDELTNYIDSTEPEGDPAPRPKQWRK